MTLFDQRLADHELDRVMVPPGDRSRRERGSRARFFRGVFMLGVLGLLLTGEARAQVAQQDDATIEELKRRVMKLERIVADLQAALRKLVVQGSPSSSAPPAPAPSDLERQLAKDLGAAPAASGTPAPVTLVSSASGKNYLNLSLDALVAAGTSTAPDVPALEPGGHDPAQRGFTVQNIETVLEGAVDPYFRGQANIILQITPEGETIVELEEAYATTSSLPHNLQAKVGQYFTEFGRLNPQHPHTWDFVDQPLVNGRMFGPDGLRGAGARVSWLMPTPFYSEVFLSVQNGHGETLTSFGSVPGDTVFGRPIVDRPVRSLNDLLYVPRYTASFDASDSQTVLVGASAAVGPNGTGADGDTKIYGVDGFWKWKPPRASKGFPFVKVQAEAMTRRYQASATSTLAADTFRDHGVYGQVVWGFRPGWVVGARYDTVGGDVGDDPLDPATERRHRTSANVTWFPTEFSKIRFQYDLDRRTVSRDAHSVWLQFEFLLGAHAAHRF